MKRTIVDLLFDKALTSLQTNSSIEEWAASVGIRLYTNQVEILNAICDETKQNIAILASRAAGKTYATALGAIKMCIENPGYEVIFFAPKTNQATRILEQIERICKQQTDTLDKEFDWGNSNKALFKLRNGSLMRAISAGEQAEIEGYHPNMVVLDESHRISDMVYHRRITPMLKSARAPKTIKIGISLGRGHFYESCHNPAWTHLVYPWDKCPSLYNAGTLTIDGQVYPTTIIKDMPLSYKQTRFPNHPELHYPSENNVSEEDFDTQYEMKWVDAVSSFLTEKDLEDMIGTHKYMQRGIDGETYFFGLDLAGGLLINQGVKRDYSSLVVVRKLEDGMKEVVHCEEWQGDIVDQMEDIVAWIHPETGRFKCRFGTADYGSLGSAVVDILNRNGLKIAGIRYNAAEPGTGMRYKTAIFNNLFTELRLGKFKYPCQHDMATNYLLKKHLEEWSVLERKVNTNGNVHIAAPMGTDEHDDAANATTLAVWAADKMEEELRRLERKGLSSRLCSPVMSDYTTASRFNPGSRTPSFLKQYFGK